MIKIAICDDENVIASQIENIIWNICKEENIPIDTDVFYSGHEYTDDQWRRNNYS